MNVPIALNSEFRNATIEYVRRPDFGFLDQWKAALGPDKHPVRTDAVVFASLACKRFKAHYEFENYAHHKADIGDHIRNNPKSEVANLVFMKCDWFPESEIIGVAHFRRSWCNNLILDYLAAHPWIAKPPPGSVNEVKGVGTALLCFLSEIGVEYNCQAIWGEATQNSCAVYQKFFGLEKVQDLLYIPHENFAKFAALIRQKWTSKT